MERRKTIARNAAVSLLYVAALCCPLSASAQFLRLGPLNFSAKTALDAIYTTNVEQERPSEATADREDWYLVWSLDLGAATDIGPNTKLTVDTGIAIEKHFVRDDLDNSEQPFGRINANADTDLDPIKLHGGFKYERTSDSVDEKFVPKDLGLPRKGRQVGTTREYIVSADWIGRIFEFGTSYDYTEDRFDDEQYQLEEQNEGKFKYYVQANLFHNINVSYEKERTETEFINRDEDPTVDETENIKLNFDKGFGLLERPEVTYSIGIKRDYEDGETKGWELTHTLNVKDVYELSPVLRLQVFATYDYEQKPESDDITFQYGLTLDHDISRRSSQSFTATRKPVQTLGSTEDTDEKKFTYDFKTKELIFEGMSFDTSLSYTISDPIEGETEKKWEWRAGLSHSVQLTRSLQRDLRYEYSWEDSNLEDEILDEHRVTLTFTYTF